MRQQHFSSRHPEGRGNEVNAPHASDCSASNEPGQVQEVLDKLFAVWIQPTIDLFCHVGEQGSSYLLFAFSGLERLGGGRPIGRLGRFQLAYAFPPQAIVPKVLQKIRESKGSTFILVASQSPSKPWLPILLELSVTQRLELNDVLTLYQYLPGFNEPEFHPDPSTLSLAGWLLSSPL